MKTAALPVDAKPYPSASVGRTQHLLPLVAPSVVLILLFVVWLGYRGLTALTELRAARSGVTLLEGSLRATLASGGAAPASAPPSTSLVQRLSSVAQHTARARAATDDPLWRAAGDLPYVGRNFAAVRAVAAASDDVVRSGLPPLVASVGTLHAVQASRLRQGVPLGAVADLAGSLNNAVNVTASARQSLAASDPGLLLAPVAGARTELLSRLSVVDSALRSAADAASLAVPMLGAAGPRTYFVAFVNPAEARGGGGLFGGFARIQADQGRVRVTRIGSDADLPNLAQGPVGLPMDFQNRYAAYGADTDWDESNLSPNFPYTAQLWAKMYASVTGSRVDGVLSLDPQALSALLSGAPAVDVGGHARVTSANVVAFLQRDQYALPLTARERKDTLTAVARVAAKRLTDQPGSALLALLPRLGSVADGGHLRLWSASPTEQSVLARYPLAGQIPALTGPFLSVFVNNAASGKLDSYLASTTTYAVRSCRAPRRAVDVTVVLRNDAPRSGLP